MSECLNMFLISLIAAFIGAGFGVFLTLVINRQIGERRLRRRTKDILVDLRTEVISNCSTLDSLVGEIESFDNTVKERKPLPSPFLLAKLKSDSYQYALQNNLVLHLDKVAQQEGLSIRLAHYYEHCPAANSLLSRFEEYVSHFVVPFPSQREETLWKSVEQDIFRWTKELRPLLISELKHSCAIAEALGASYDELIDYKLKYH